MRLPARGPTLLLLSLSTAWLISAQDTLSRNEVQYDLSPTTTTNWATVGVEADDWVVQTQSPEWEPDSALGASATTYNDGMWTAATTTPTATSTWGSPPDLLGSPSGSASASASSPTSSTVSVAGGACGGGVTCPLSAPCCSEYGVCGTGRSCLAGCSPFYSFSAGACAPMAACAASNLTFDGSWDAAKVVSTGSEWNGDGTTYDLIVDSVGSPSSGRLDSTLLLAVNKSAPAGTKISTTRSILYGNVTARMQVPAVAGIVTSFALESGTGDEAIWEFTTDNSTMGGTAYFHNGNTSDYSSLQDLDIPDRTASHDYTIAWTPNSLTYLVDAIAVRTVLRSDTLQADGTYAFPVTPARVRIHTWAAGVSTQPLGTVAWSGGKVDWTTTEYKNGSYYGAELEWLDMSCYTASTAASSYQGDYVQYEAQSTSTTVWWSPSSSSSSIAAAWAQTTSSTTTPGWGQSSSSSQTAAWGGQPSSSSSQTPPQGWITTSTSSTAAPWQTPSSSSSLAWAWDPPSSSPPVASSSTQAPTWTPQLISSSASSSMSPGPGWGQQTAANSPLAAMSSAATSPSPAWDEATSSAAWSPAATATIFPWDVTSTSSAAAASGNAWRRAVHVHKRQSSTGESYVYSSADASTGSVLVSSSDSSPIIDNSNSTGLDMTGGNEWAYAGSGGTLTGTVAFLTAATATDAQGKTIGLSLETNAVKNNSTDFSAALSGGAIAGIILGCIAGLLVLGAVGYALRKHILAKHGSPGGGSLAAEKGMFGSYAPVGDMGETLATGAMYHGGEGELYDGPSAVGFAPGAAAASEPPKPWSLSDAGGWLSKARESVTSAVSRTKTPASLVQGASADAALGGPNSAAPLERKPTFRGGYVPSAALRDGSLVGSAYEQ